MDTSYCPKKAAGVISQVYMHVHWHSALARPDGAFTSSCSANLGSYFVLSLGLRFGTFGHLSSGFARVQFPFNTLSKLAARIGV